MFRIIVYTQVRMPDVSCHACWQSYFQERQNLPQTFKEEYMEGRHAETSPF